MLSPHRAAGGYVAVLALFALVLSHLHRADPLSNFDRAGGFHFPLSDALRNATLEELAASSPPGPDGPDGLRPADGAERICVVVPTRSRGPSVDYLGSTLTSLSAGLTPAQRADLHVVVFFVDGADALARATAGGLFRRRLADAGTFAGDPTRPTALTPWLAAQKQRLNHLHHAPYLLTFLAGVDQCIEHTSAQHIISLEDDMVARPDWLAVLQREILPKLRRVEWLFTMLFFSEAYMFWAAEDVLLLARQIARPLAAVALGSLVVFVLRRRAGATDPSLSSPSARRRQTTQHIALTVAAILLLAPFVGLNLYRGKFAIFPVAPALSLKTERECCAQSLLFSRPSAAEVLARFVPIVEGDSVDWSVRGHDDVLFELGMAGPRRGFKFSPSLLQHFGDVSTYVAGTGKPRLRSWTFELGLRQGAGGAG